MGAHKIWVKTKDGKDIMEFWICAGQYTLANGGGGSGWVWALRRLSDNTGYVGYLDGVNLRGLDNSGYGTLTNFKQELREGGEFSITFPSGIFTCKVYAYDPSYPPVTLKAKPASPPPQQMPPQIPTPNRAGGYQQMEIWMNQQAIELVP